MSYSAKEVIFLEDNGLIPSSLIFGWEKGAGHNPIARARAIVEDANSSRTLVAIIVLASVLSFVTLASDWYHHKTIEHVFVLLSFGGMALLVSVLLAMKWTQASRFRNVSGNFGHDLGEILRISTWSLAEMIRSETKLTEWVAAHLKFRAGIVCLTQEHELSSPDSEKCAQAAVDAKREFSETYRLFARFSLADTVLGWKPYFSETGGIRESAEPTEAT